VTDNAIVATLQGVAIIQGSIFTELRVDLELPGNVRSRRYLRLCRNDDKYVQQIVQFICDRFLKMVDRPGFGCCKDIDVEVELSEISSRFESIVCNNMAIHDYTVDDNLRYIKTIDLSADDIDYVLDDD
jgi:hypothetical protein